MSMRKIAAIGEECVACGTCLRICPVRALSVFKGIRATVDAEKCVGCGKCAQICPAGVVEMTEKEASHD